MHLLRGALLALILVPSLAWAQPAEPRERSCEAWKLFWTERRIEASMLLGQARGLLSRRPPDPDWTPRSEGEGRLERGPGGVPILYLSGTPEAMGRQHGALMGREMQALQHYVRAFVGRRRLPKAMRRARRLFLERCPPEYVREVRAMAKAADMRFEEVLFAQWFTDLYRGFGCSSLAAPSAEGPLLARNLDFPSMGYLQRYSVVVVARPAGKRPFVSVSWPGLVGVLSGQNADVAISTLVVHDSSGVRSGLPFQLAYRRVLEQAGSAAEADELMRRTSLTVTNNLMVVDREGDTRVLELHPERVVTRRAVEDRLVATNHFVTRERKRPRLGFTSLSSEKRFRTVREECPADSDQSEVDLAAVHRALDESAVAFTVQSMVFFPREGALEVAFAERAPTTRHGRFVRLSRSVLLGATR